MRVILVCSAGMSTSLLVRQMEKWGAAEEVIEAYPYSQLKERIQDYDVLLVGPQIRFMFDDIKKIAEENGKGVALIPISVYGSRDGKAAMELARSQYKK